MGEKFLLPQGGPPLKSSPASRVEGLGGVTKVAGDVASALKHVSGAGSAVKSFSGLGLSAGLKTWLMGLGAFTGLLKVGIPLMSQASREVHEQRMARLPPRNVPNAPGPPDPPGRRMCSREGECLAEDSSKAGYDCGVDGDTGRKVCTRKSDGKVFIELPDKKKR